MTDAVNEDAPFALLERSALFAFLLDLIQRVYRPSIQSAVTDYGLVIVGGQSLNARPPILRVAPVLFVDSLRDPHRCDLAGHRAHGYARRLARVIAVWGAAQPHYAYLFAAMDLPEQSSCFRGHD